MPSLAHRVLREGEVRYSWTSATVTTPAYSLTKYSFTGQYSYMDDPSTTGVAEGFGLMFYNARMYDPAIGRFTSADSIVPDGVQGYDRYAYVNNSPVNFVDPTGHDPKGNCYDKGYCKYEDLTPGDLIENEQDRLTHCNNVKDECRESYVPSKLTNDIEKYLLNNPDYDPLKDPKLGDNFSEISVNRREFNYQRELYWVDRAKNAGLCKLMCQGIAGQLTRYYDYHENFTDIRWVGNPGNVMLDIIGIPLGFVGEGYINVSAKAAFQGISASSALISGYDAASKGDILGVGLAGLGVFPVVGAFASGASLSIELSKIQEFEYIPLIPR